LDYKKWAFISLFLFYRGYLRVRIEQLLAPILAEKNAFLVEIVIGREGSQQVYQIFVDTDDKITLDQCAAISRELADLLEEQDDLGIAYTLEVSSPGLTRPLTHPRQFIKSVGRDMIVSYSDAEGVSRTDDLTLKTVSDNSYEFENKKKLVLSIAKDKIVMVKYRLKW
jgi:ribosome maturation factor RimP